MDEKQDVEVVVQKQGENCLSYTPVDVSQGGLDHEQIYDAWGKADFQFIEEKGSGKGLRSPQLGGLFSTLGHLKANPVEPATIVMPTGTGKTETMLSLVVAGKFERTLVIVPSDALREQTCSKFARLGLLRDFRLVPENFPNPKILKLKQGIKDLNGLDLVKEANVVVTTANSLSNCSGKIFDELVLLFSHLIIDEAHHIAARTWNRVKGRFLHKKPILQFTATPFRADGQRVDGKLVFCYSIEDAQKDNYFKKIEFHPVTEFVEEEIDQRIAEKAIELLVKDTEEKREHILMARANTIPRAKAIYKIYERYKKFSPILITSKEKKRKSILADIKNGKHKIIVCVDMLGEGFDLPELKIAALHDVHKSINITLQFIGRFTREKSRLGDAKFVANIADPGIGGMLDTLYEQDADWNRIVRDVGAKKIHEEKEYQEFRSQFNTETSKLIDQGLKPKVSTIIFKTSSKSFWQPARFQSILDKNSELVDSTINKDQTILLFSVKTFRKVPWSSSQGIRDITWDLYMVYFDKKIGLIYAHSSCKKGKISKLIEKIAGEVQRVRGESVFRAMAGIKRLRFQNVGLNKDKRKLRYIMYTGTDTQEAIPLLESSKTRKSNLFGKGFEGGIETTIGCSHKGKIWAMDSSSVNKWVSWCDRVGKKITDSSIDTNQIMKTAIKSEILKHFPDFAVVGIDWPSELLRKNEGSISWKYNGQEYSFLESDIVMATGTVSGKSATFTIGFGGKTVPFTFQLKNDDFAITTGQNLQLKFGNKEYEASDYFTENPPLIYLADTSTIDGAYRHFSTEDDLQPYNVDTLDVWDWKDVDISVESQRKEKLKHSIQYHTIKKIQGQYDIVFDDDGSQEIADIVGIKNIRDEQIVVDFYHCKYCSKGKKPGSRVDDVYQVAGQVMKGCKWANNSEKLFDRLIDREVKRLGKKHASRIDKGDLKELQRLQKVVRMARITHTFYVVQPAISKTTASRELLSVLGVAELYVMDTTGARLEVVVSE